MSKIALIFGGSRGIGQGIAKVFYCNGYETVVSSKDERRLNESVTKLQERKSNSLTGLQCDVTEENSVQRVFNEVNDLFGTCPDVVVNSAGINIDGLLVKYSLQHMEDILRTNLVGSMLTTKFAVQHMLRKRKNGSIVNVGSIVGSKGHRGQSVYSASKAGLVGLTKSVAREVAKDRGIRVNLVVPGFIETEMTTNAATDASQIPLGRFGLPEEVAQVVYFLCTSTYITGQVVPVDGGLHLSL